MIWDVLRPSSEYSMKVLIEFNDHFLETDNLNSLLPHFFLIESYYLPQLEVIIKQSRNLTLELGVNFFYLLVELVDTCSDRKHFEVLQLMTMSSLEFLYLPMECLFCFFKRSKIVMIYAAQRLKVFRFSHFDWVCGWFDKTVNSFQVLIVPQLLSIYEVHNL